MSSNVFVINVPIIVLTLELPSNIIINYYNIQLLILIFHGSFLRESKNTSGTIIILNHSRIC